VPWIFLGLALLAKGPLLLIFFYAVVLAVLYREGELRQLWKPAHLLGIVVMCAIFAAWAIPCLQLMRESDVAQRWTHEFTGRLAGEDFKWSGWLLNIPRGLAYFLPWLLCLPFLRRGMSQERALAWGIAIPFLVVSLLPGTLPRYTMPLLVPAAWLFASLLKGELRIPLTISAITGAAMLIYGFALTPFLQRRERVRNLAAEINRALPPNDVLYAIDPDYQPFLFYVRDPIFYVARAEELPPSARYIMVQPGNQAQSTSGAHEILRLKDYRNKEVILLKKDG
jgi:4-amino-4-deoxy-L-arabinose transferase-like glycosyltransferase